MPRTDTTAVQPSAPDQRGGPAPDVAQLRLELARDALSYIVDLSVAVEKTMQAARRMQADQEEDEADGLMDCAAIAQSLVSYVAVRAGDVMRGHKPGEPGYVGDTAAWVMPQALERLLWQIEREAAQ